MSGLNDQSRACERRQDEQDPGGLRSKESLHLYPHRMPAPSVRAIDAMIANARVKRARFAFTFVLLDRAVRLQTGNRAALAIISRPQALRPRLTTGLPWTICRRRTSVVLNPNARARFEGG